MKILVLGTLLKQTSSRGELPSDIIKMIYKEYQVWNEIEKEDSINGNNDKTNEYLDNNQTDKFEGEIEKRWKYRITNDYRIIFTYGKYLPLIKEKEPNSLILLACARHENQEEVAKRKDFEREKFYKSVHDIIDEKNQTNINSDNGNVSYTELYSDNVLSNGKTINKILHKNDLSPKQEQIIKNFLGKSIPQPTLILGGGGCGKTVIATFLFKELYHNENFPNNAYFTQSEELRKQVKRIYDNIDLDIENDKTTTEEEKNKRKEKEEKLTQKAKENTLNINDFCLEKLGKTAERKNFIYKINDFNSFIKNKSLSNKLSERNLNIEDVWAEIRGTIKGSMQAKLTKGITWQRTTYANQKEFSQIEKNGKTIYKDINILKDYIERHKDKKQEFKLKYSVEETKEKIKTDDKIDEDEKTVLNNIIKYFQSFNTKLKGLDREIYLNLSEEESTLEKSVREFIYDEIYTKYNSYCEEYNKFDENDLVCMMFEKFGEQDFPKFSSVIVDEVQDYTEMQIYLLHKICEKPNRIIFAGDSHQMINPTMFSTKRLKELFFDYKKDNISLDIQYLNVNFRCRHKIVTVGNYLSDVRREIIGKQENETEQYEKGIGADDNQEEKNAGEIPIRLKYSKENAKKLVEEILKTPSTAILVADEPEKNKLINFYGKEQYEAKDQRIFTVAEIKGMEYEYVVCFNLISKYIDIWNNLMQKLIGRKSIKYRYYFNLIYVAITRAKEYLYFIDENINQKLEDKLKLSNIDDFDKEKLFFHTISEEEEKIKYLQDALNFEENGLYDLAKGIYENHFKEDWKSIYRCDAHISENKNDYEKALQYYMLIEDIEAILKLKDSIKKDNPSLYKLCNAITNPELVTYKEYEKEEVLNLIHECFRNSKNDADRIKIFILKEFNKYLTSLY